MSPKIEQKANDEDEADVGSEPDDTRVDESNNRTADLMKSMEHKFYRIKTLKNSRPRNTFEKASSRSRKMSSASSNGQ